MLVSIIPTFIFCLLMNLLPQFIKLAIKLLSFPSQAKNMDMLYIILFIFLILIQGIIQVAFPSMLDV